MPLPALATAADMVTYGYDAVANAILARASARVRRFVRQQITAGSSTLVLHRPGPWLLPQRPVTAITSLVDEDAAAVPYELHGPVLHPTGCPRLPLTVTWQHGHAVLPDELVELVCAIAARLGPTPASVGAGVRTEQAGGEAVTWGVEAFQSASGLTAGEEKALRRLFPKRPRTIHLI